MNKSASQKKMTLERLADIVEAGFTRVDRKFDGVDKKFDGIDQRFDGIDKRLDGFDKKFQGVDKNFISFDSRFTALDKKIDERIDELAMMTARGFLSLQTDMDLKFARVDDSFKNVRRDILAIHDTWKDHELRIAALEKSS